MENQETRAAAMERLTQSGGHGVLRFLTCGSVDDGKSTLIGRLLYDSKLLFEDQLSVLARDSRKHGTVGEEIDFALLLDGLEAEREQGITIDVAYRYFATEKRKFVVADTPGHEQYTRNMATGASTADVAVMMIDARKGVLIQTLRHTYIARMMGIRHIVLAVNKMDLVEHSRGRFHEIVAEYMNRAENLGFETITPIPMSARYGENVTLRSEKMAWHTGPTLIEYLETLDIATDIQNQPFRMPVQWVNRPNLNFRGYSGMVVSGSIKPGDAVIVAKSGTTAKVSRIVTADGDLDEAVTGDSITLVLNHEMDISRGDVLSAAEERPEVSDQFAAAILWMNQDDLLPGRSYLLKIGTATTPATISSLRHRVDVNTYEKKPCRKLEMNGIGMCNVSTAKPIVFDAYHKIRDMGAFILIDRFTNQTVGAGMIEFGLRRASNIHHHAMTVTKEERSQIKAQKPAVLWFTGLSGAGKSTVANLVEQKLARAGHHTYSLDGDNVRHGLNRDLGFTDEDRVENIRRIGEVGRLFVEAGLLVTCSFISPFRSERQMVRELVEENEFIEVFVDTPLEVCIQRDPKGLYKKAKAGEIKNFTGFDSPYEAPESPELRIDTSEVSAEDAADLVVAYLRGTGRLG
tara:strand:+ start:5071 stop:6966 length:1896 start_codon:yes stop_codon:yes gene_type:complete